MTNNPEQLSPEEALRADNEIKSLNLELKYGALHSHISEDAPPELIGRWLDNVTSYEEQYAKAEKVTIHEFVGKPVLQKVSSLKDSELESEIKRLTAVLEKHFVMTGFKF